MFGKHFGHFARSAGLNVSLEFRLFSGSLAFALLPANLRKIALHDGQLVGGACLFQLVEVDARVELSAGYQFQRSRQDAFATRGVATNGASVEASVWR